MKGLILRMTIIKNHMRNLIKKEEVGGGDFVWFGTLPKGQGHYITLIQQKEIFQIEIHLYQCLALWFLLIPSFQVLQII
jgi:hypothetical protein